MDENRHWEQEAEAEWSGLCAGTGGGGGGEINADGGWRRSARVGQREGHGKTGAPSRGRRPQGQRWPGFTSKAQLALNWE